MNFKFYVYIINKLIFVQFGVNFRVYINRDCDSLSILGTLQELSGSKLK